MSGNKKGMIGAFLVIDTERGLVRGVFESRKEAMHFVEDDFEHYLIAEVCYEV